MFTKFKATRKPWMDDKEIAVILKHLKAGDVMLEWGSGGSTLFFSEHVKKYYSLESDPKWAPVIRRRVWWKELREKWFHGRQEPKVIYRWVKFPIPKRTIPSKYEDYKDFIEEVDRLGVARFDKVLIDGRARDHCAEKILDYIDGNSIVFIHDFYMAGREYYSRVLQWYDVVESVKDTPQTLVVLRKKEKKG